MEFLRTTGADAVALRLHRCGSGEAHQDRHNHPPEHRAPLLRDIASHIGSVPLGKATPLQVTHTAPTSCIDGRFWLLASRAYGPRNDDRGVRPGHFGQLSPIGRLGEFRILPNSSANRRENARRRHATLPLADNGLIAEPAEVHTMGECFRFAATSALPSTRAGKIARRAHRIGCLCFNLWNRPECGNEPLAGPCGHSAACYR
jgi:hypothetical protein